MSYYDESNIYFCKKCGWRTSGLTHEELHKARCCPKCKSLLIQCDHCFLRISMTKTIDVYTCDNCGLPVSDEKIKQLKGEM